MFLASKVFVKTEDPSKKINPLKVICNGREVISFKLVENKKTLRVIAGKRHYSINNTLQLINFQRIILVYGKVICIQQINNKFYYIVR